MASFVGNTKRVAKNTLLLYARMLLLMFISLYTSRVVLNILGEEDYGLYNVVGGVVALFSVISGTLSSAISRFITFEIGKGNNGRVGLIFSSAIIVQIVLAGIIAFMAETIGLWFLNTQMTIPDTRIQAARWVYQFSILTFVINLLSIPYNATIIAYEKMAAFAYISIVEAAGHLAVAFLIALSPCDKLVFYALLMCAVAVIVRILYATYCRRHFNECRFRPTYDKSILKQMFSFAGWNFIGSSSAILRDQGGNILINIFCGPGVNAARAIAVQVRGAVNQFATNFMTALNPQITKSYASGEYKYMKNLLLKGCRFSCYLLLILALPILFNTEYILVLWLKTVPEHTVRFVQLMLIFAISEAISYPLNIAQQATGDIKKYQILVGGLLSLNLPLAYLFLKFGSAPESVFVIAIAISQCCLVGRLYIVRKTIMLSATDFIKKVYLNVIAVGVIASVIPFLISRFIEINSPGNLVLACSVSLLNSAIAIMYIGCSYDERKYLISKVSQMINKLRHIK